MYFNYGSFGVFFEGQVIDWRILQEYNSESVLNLDYTHIKWFAILFCEVWKLIELPTHLLRL